MATAEVIPDQFCKKLMDLRSHPRSLPTAESVQELLQPLKETVSC